jgi:Na+/H+-dicarboxylate symporter
MSRTTVNVAGDVAVATIVDRWTVRTNPVAMYSESEPEPVTMN